MKIFAGVDKLHQSLDYHLARHNLLSANLANVDTPNYRARDLERVDAPSFEAQLASAMGGPTVAAEAPKLRTRVVIDDSVPVDSDGNNVSLDREAVKVSANHVRYDSISTLVSGQLSSLLWAVTDGKGG